MLCTAVVQSSHLQPVMIQLLRLLIIELKFGCFQMR